MFTNEKPVANKDSELMSGQEFFAKSGPASPELIPDLPDILCAVDHHNTSAHDLSLSCINHPTSVSACGREVEKLVLLVHELGNRVEKLEVEKAEAGAQNRQLVERVAQLEIEISKKNYCAVSCSLSKGRAAPPPPPPPPPPPMVKQAPPTFKVRSMKADAKKENRRKSMYIGNAMLAPADTQLSLDLMDELSKKLQRLRVWDAETPNTTAGHPSDPIQTALNAPNIKTIIRCRSSPFRRSPYRSPSVKVFGPRRQLHKIMDAIQKSGISAAGSPENDVSRNLIGLFKSESSPIDRSESTAATRL